MKVLAKMTRDVVTVAVDDDIGMAFELMIDGNFHHLPVVDAGAVVGIISDRDILLHASGR